MILVSLIVVGFHVLFWCIAAWQKKIVEHASGLCVYSALFKAIAVAICGVVDNCIGRYHLLHPLCLCILEFHYNSHDSLVKVNHTSSYLNPL